MQTSTLRTTDMYMSVLSSLSVDDKLDLISKLSDSIRHADKKDILLSEDPFACFKGDWSDFNPNQARHSERTIDTW